MVRSPLQVAVGKLPIEAKKQATHVKQVDKKLANLKEMVNQQKMFSYRTFLHTCILPRLQQSAEDAMYCAKFIQRLHSMDMPFFKTVPAISEVFVKSFRIIWQEACHAKEALIEPYLKV